MVVIEMNPRVSRCSALASKATGFPIAKIAAKLAVGYTLDEIPNDITRETMASFEPTIDYCVVKIPRWTFEKFPGTEDFLTTSMKSVGRGHGHRPDLQGGPAERDPFPGDRPVRIRRPTAKDRSKNRGRLPSLEEIRQKLAMPNSQRIFYLRSALKAGMDPGDHQPLTGIDPWFLEPDRPDSLGRGQDRAADGGYSPIERTC